MAKILLLVVLGHLAAALLLAAANGFAVPTDSSDCGALVFGAGAIALSLVCNVGMAAASLRS